MVLRNCFLSLPSIIYLDMLEDGRCPTGKMLLSYYALKVANLAAQLARPTHKIVSYFVMQSLKPTTQLARKTFAIIAQ